VRADRVPQGTKKAGGRKIERKAGKFVGTRGKQERGGGERTDFGGGDSLSGHRGSRAPKNGSGGSEEKGPQRGLGNGRRGGKEWNAALNGAKQIKGIGMDLVFPSTMHQINFPLRLAKRSSAGGVQPEGGKNGRKVCVEQKEKTIKPLKSPGPAEAAL